MEKIYQPRRQKYFTIHWDLGYVCNYNCSYCLPHLHNATYWNNSNDIEQFIDKLIENNKKITKRTEIYFSGGEPTLNKDLPKFMKKLKENDIDVHLISNGSQKYSWWEKNVNNFTWAYLSFHNEFASVEHFKKVFDIDPGSFEILFLMDPNNFEYCKKCFLDLREFTIDSCIKKIGKPFYNKVTPKLVKPMKENKIQFKSDFSAYNEDQLDFIKSFYDNKNKKNEEDSYGGLIHKEKNDITEKHEPHQLISNKENSFKGYYCNAGIDSLRIDNKGNIFRANCMIDFLGNISDKNFKFPKDPIICDRDYCHCTADLSVLKWRNNV